MRIACAELSPMTGGLVSGSAEPGPCTEPALHRPDSPAPRDFAFVLGMAYELLLYWNPHGSNRKLFAVQDKQSA